MTWHGFTLLGETARSVSSRPFSALVVGLIVAGAGVASGACDMLAWRDDANLAATQEASGSMVIRASAGDGAAGISTDACLSLNRASGVRAAGGVAAGNLAYAQTSPGLGFRVLPAAGRLVGALTGTGQTVEPLGPGLVVADEVAQQVGLTQGSWIVVDGVRTKIAAVLPLGQRDPQLGRVALNFGAPPQRLTACYVEFTDGYALQTLSGQLPSVFAATPNLQLARLFATGNGTPDPAQLWDRRPVRDLFLPLGVLAALVFLLMARSRRNEYSIYLVTGSSRTNVAVIILIGGYAITTAALAVAIAWLALLGHLWRVPGYGFELGVVAATRTAMATAALLPLSLMWLIRANLHRLLRERAS